MTFVIINGSLTADPRQVMRRTANGQVQVVELRIAVNVFVGGVTYTNYFNATVWPGRWEGIVRNLAKGSAVMILGTLTKTNKPELQTTYI